MNPLRSTTTQVAALIVAAASLSCIALACISPDGPPPGEPPPPVVLDFEEEATDKKLRWFVPTQGWSAELVADRPASGARCIALRKVAESTAPFGNVMMGFDATPYRGRRVALTAQVRIAGEGQAQMWLRVDRPGDRTGAFDNMGDRPIRAEVWTPAEIVADVSDDAESIALGWMSIGGAATVYVDEARLAVVGAAAPVQPASPPRELSARGLENVEAATRLFSYLRFFHPSDQAIGVGSWDMVALDLIERAEPARDAAELAQRLAAAVAALAPTIQIWAGGPADAPPAPPVPDGATQLASWRHSGAGTLRTEGGGPYASFVDRRPLAKPIDAAALAALSVVKPLGGGVSCRVPVTLFADAQRTLPHGETPAAFTATAVPPAPTVLNRSTRLAGVALAWGVFQHFYPYFDVVDTDWNAALAPALRKAAIDVDERAYLRTLQELVAKLRDGHGSVYSSDASFGAGLPVRLRWCGDDLVVVGVHPAAPADIKLGDALLSVDERSVAELEREFSTQISAATEGWRRMIVASRITLADELGPPMALRLRRPDGGEYSIAVPRISPANIADAVERRPANGSELAPGIAYFDLDGSDVEALGAAMEKLVAAKAIVFDLRGYPGRAAYELIQHLVDAPTTSARWNVPRVTFPDGERWEWIESGRWQMPPLEPRLRQPIAFLTDGRAISYAESIMGIVEADKLGEIVGATTAGTNGNVNPFELPGGYRVSWTGMKVLKHDGSRHHGVGIAPTVPVEPTAKGVAAGRDEVLEKAVEVLQARIEDAGK